MAGKMFYLRKRGESWQARFVDQDTGKVITTRSIPESTRDKAYRTATMWSIQGLPETRKRPAQTVQQVVSTQQLFEQVKNAPLSPAEAQQLLAILIKKGLIAKPGSIDDLKFIPWLREFYTYEKSPYVREKHAQGHSIGKGHCIDLLSRVENHWAPFFDGKSISQITRADLKSFGLVLKDKGLSANSINKTLSAGKVALKWAKDEALIAINPAENLTSFSGEVAKRDILSDQESQDLFQVTWKDERAKVGNMLAEACGTRAGEILALRVEDIGIDRLYIRHSWSSYDGLKCPKNGTERQVPLLPHLREGLLKIASQNPWDDGFVFFSSKRGQPMDQKFLLNGLLDALEKIGIDEELRKKRNIVFHSWRHRYAAKMSEKVDARSLGLSTGHKTPAMLEHYANHANEEHFQSVLAANKDIFSPGGEQ